MRIEASITTRWPCDFCYRRQGSSNAPRFLIGSYRLRNCRDKDQVICDQCVAICHQAITRLKAARSAHSESSERIQLLHF